MKRRGTILLSLAMGICSAAILVRAWPAASIYEMEQQMPVVVMNTQIDVTDDRWASLSQRRIFFGHQSVGRDLLTGIREFAQLHPELGLRVINTTEPGSLDGPGLFEADLGINGQPQTKDSAFMNVLAHGFGGESNAVAMLKYCYLDFRVDTDAETRFREYEALVDSIHARYPTLTLVHFTAPLHWSDGGIYTTVKSWLGRPTQTLLNEKRNQYNQLIRQRYAGREPIFDLALIQSTRRDGTRAFTRFKGRNVYMLAPEWTHDGGHLSAEAQRLFGKQLLLSLLGLGDNGIVHQPRQDFD